MCDRCTEQGLKALEAIANGEEIPEPPEPTGLVGVAAQAAGLKQHEPRFELPFPVIAFETDNGNVGILTDQAGWTFFKNVLEKLGGVDHH
jgi:hypothetical protein